MSAIPDQQMETSPLSGEVTVAGQTTHVYIYRFARSVSEWTLVVRNDDGSLKVWDSPFPSDKAAHRAFEMAAADEGPGSAHAVKLGDAP